MLGTTMWPRALCLVLLCVACAPDQEQLPVYETDRHLGQSTWMVGGRYSHLWFFVLDDANTPASTVLREGLVEAFAYPEAPRPLSLEACPGSPEDPARRDPMDVRVVIARPTWESELRLITPHENPGLVWLGERDEPGPYAAFLEAGKEEFGRTSSGPKGTFTAIQTAADFLSLLAGQRPPRSLREEQELATLAPLSSSYVSTVIVTTRDDQSQGEPTDYDISGLVSSDEYRYGFQVLLSPNGTEGVNFVPGSDETPRFAPWLAGIEWRSGASRVEQLFSPVFSTHFYPRCWTRPPQRFENGSVDCRVHLTTRDLSPCSSHLGRLDPLVGDGSEQREPKLELDDWQRENRICEIEQLTGPPLQNCLTAPERPIYATGWCRPEPSEACRDSCVGPGEPIALRFVGGADNSWHGGKVSVDCTLDESP